MDWFYPELLNIERAHIKLELTKHITLHANCEPRPKLSSSYSHSSLVLQQFCLLSGLPMVSFKVNVLSRAGVDSPTSPTLAGPGVLIMWVCRSPTKSDQINGLSDRGWKGKKENTSREKLTPQLGNEPLPFCL